MRRILACLALLALPNVVTAETHQHGNLIFDIPVGWTAGAVHDDGSLTLYSDLPNDECAYCYIYIATGDAGTVPMDIYLNAQTLRFVEPDGDKAPQVQPMASEMVNISGRPGGLQGQTVDGHLQILVAVQLSGRMELIGFETSASDETETTADLRIFERDVMPLIEGARYVSEGAKALLPEPQPGSRIGVYWGASTWWTLGLDGMMQMQIDHRWLTFWPDGLFYDGTPPAGTSEFDTPAALAKGDMSWGSYREEDGKLILSFASGEIEELAVEGDGLGSASNVLWPIDPLADGTRINGSISTMFFSGFSPGSGVSGGVSSSSVTEFHPDFTWSFGSSGGAFGSFDAGGGYAVSSGSESQGRYEVKDGLLMLYSGDGSVKRADFIYKAGTDVWIGAELLTSD
ncbi:MAG: hypothetical protein WAT09_01890 [Paracoccaceae bacterium]